VSETRDHNLVDRAVAGDRTALSELWRQHRSWLATVLLGNLPAGIDLEDLMQDVAVRVVGEIHRLKRPAALRAWLRVVALNAARSAARRQAVGRGRARSLEADAPELADPSHDVRGRNGEVRQHLQRVMRVLAGFHPDYREPLLLKSVHGWTQKRIAATLGLPETAVESRLARARRMLRQELADRNPEADRADGPIATDRPDGDLSWKRLENRA